MIGGVPAVYTGFNGRAAAFWVVDVQKCRITREVKRVIEVAFVTIT
jgi:hypothetical protein